MNRFRNKTFEYVFVFLIVIVLFTAVASYFYYKSDNAVGPNLITAFVGVVMSAMVTLVLLNGQTKDEEVKERKMKLYNAKLRVYSNFVSIWYNTYNNQITQENLRNLRAILFGKVFFYVENEDAFEVIEKELCSIIGKNKEIDANDPKMTVFFTKLESLLQKDLNGIPIKPEKPFFHKLKYLFAKNKQEAIKDDYKREIWRYLDQIIVNTAEDREQYQNLDSPTKTEYKTNHLREEERIDSNITIKLQEDIKTDEPKALTQQTWHFIMWSDEQLERLKNGFKELSLIEYGEYWRTNLVKQVGKNDIVFLFRRGHNGYVGAYKAIGWRVFYFEEGREEIQNFDDNGLREINKKEDEKQYLSDIEDKDIYNSKEDGATTCANIIVEPIAFVEEGVGYPGGVYRRTISRYDSNYAGLLMERFNKAQKQA